MLNWKSQQFTKNLFPKKQTPMRNKKNWRGKKSTPFIAVQEIHLLKYIYFYIYRYYFFKFKHPKFKREREKKPTKQVSSPPPSRICWSLLVQNQKELFTERKTGGERGCRREENEVVTHGEEIVGFGPRRGEASLSSTTRSLRKMPHWGSVPRVPLPSRSAQGCCLSGSCLRPTPGARCLSLSFSPHPPLVFPRQQASPGHLQPKVHQEQRECLGGLCCTHLSPFMQIHNWQQWLLPFSLPPAPFAAHTFHSQSRVTECSTKLCVHRSLTPAPQVPLHETHSAAS